MALNKDQKYILIVLSLINFVNYLDRQVVFPLFDSIKAEFHVNDFQLGLLATVFMIMHSLASLPFGMWADKYSRKMVVAVGVGVWSLSTFFSGLARSFTSLLSARSIVAIGESAYAPGATAMISDNFPQGIRARAQGFINIGMFMGGTLGAMIGGVIVYYLGNWRLAFFLVSIPGIILCLLALRMKEKKIEHNPEHNVKIWDYFKNPAFIWILIGSVLVTFTSGAFISWGVEFTHRIKGYNLRDASLILGSIIMVSGVLGIYLGSHIADKVQAKYKSGRSIVIALSLLISTPLMLLAISDVGSGWGFIILLFLGSVFLNFYHGPAIVVLHDIVPVHKRASVFAVYTLLIHLLGDAISPAVVGALSDKYNLQFSMELVSLLVIGSGLAYIMVARVVAKDRVRLYLD